MQQRRDEAFQNHQPFSIHAQWIALQDIPQHVMTPILVSEDALFPSHKGFDWQEIRQSIALNIKRKAFIRGGSTISQQLVKNLFLSTTKHPIRKLKEAVLTYWLEHTLTKPRILELYLNVIEWGDGVFGIDAAARRYFKKSASQLTREEAARLAAVLPNPRNQHPNTNSSYILRRKNQILSRAASYTAIFP